jgi:enoyl-CoA hydratase/carnithine racemase/DNA-binding NarL/FixJ family response regulator
MPVKVLAFEGDGDFAEALQAGLDAAGCQVHVVSDGATGLERARKDPPDVILLAIELPEGSGFSVCNKLKKDPELKDIPVIIMSSESGQETFERHRKLRTHADAYVHKPIRMGDLVRVMRPFVHFSSERRMPSAAPQEEEPEAPEGEVLSEVRDGIGWVTLSRPHKKNSLTRSMWAAIPDVLADLKSRGDLTAVAIRGAGGTFGAGADLGDVLAATEGRPEAEEYCTLVVRGIVAVARCSLPTVALVEGVAAGGGAELAIAADTRMADSRAVISFPFARLGVVPDRFTLARLQSLVGPSAARSLALTGKMVAADEAEEMGLVDEVLAAGELGPRALAWSRMLAQGSPSAIAGMKAIFFDRENKDTIATLIGPMVESFVNGDVRAAALRFLGKPP